MPVVNFSSARASSGSLDQPDFGWRRLRSKNYQWLIAIVGTLIAFILGYVFVTNYPLDQSWHQRYLSPALNYACAGHFGPLRLPENPPAEDVAAMQAVNEFLHVATLQFSCSSFPRRVIATSVFDGLDSSNTEQPIYLMLLYGGLWRLFGVDWTVTYYIIATVIAVSFLAAYLCTRRLMPGFIAAPAILLFFSSPLFIKSILSPRDVLKLPFIIVIAALLIGHATPPRRPLRFLAFASGIGLLIGLAYGFRADLLLFILPAGLIIALLGRVELAASLSRVKRALASSAVRLAAVGALLLSFAVGAWLPLLNDYKVHESNRDVAYHSLAAGWSGITNYDLFQNHAPDGGMYMFRNSYSNDLFIGVRVLEYASRRYDDHTVPWAQGRYWTYAKRFYLDVASHVPGDLISGAIGAFVNLMTVPASTNSLAPFADPFRRWTETYSFARNTAFFDHFVKPMERLSMSGQLWFVDVMLVINIAVTFVFLCLIASRFGFRSVVATVIVLGTVLCVISLRFELRHVIYVYLFPVIAWASVTWLLLEFFLSMATIAYHRLVGTPIEKIDLLASCIRAGATVSSVALLALGVGAAVYLALGVARAYQADRLNSLISDWLMRQRVPVQFDKSESVRGMSIVQIRSAMPTSAGGLRAAHDPVPSRVEMGVVAVEFDGASCAGRLVSVTGVGGADPEFDTSFLIRETFSIRLEQDKNYIAFLPAFFYELGGVRMRFLGVEMATQDLSCMKSVAAVSEFKKDDLLFDFFVPDQSRGLRKEDLFQRVTLPIQRVKLPRLLQRLNLAS